MTTPLQITRYDRLVRRAMNLVGEGAIVTGVLPDVFPVIDLENIPIELRALAGWRVGWRSTEFIGAVAEFATIQAFNPVGSGKLVVVTDAWIESQSNVTLRAVIETTAHTFSAFFDPLDSRMGVAENLSTELRFVSAAAAIGVSWRGSILARTTYHLKSEGGVAVLFPGTGFSIQTNNANAQLGVTYKIRERPFDSAEQL